MRHKTICYIKPVPNILEPLIPHFKRSFPYVDRILFIRSISLIMYNIYSSIMQNTVIFPFYKSFSFVFCQSTLSYILWYNTKACCLNMIYTIILITI